MFSGILISSASGVGKTSNREWFRLELISTTLTDKKKVMQCFVTENAFRQAQNIPAMSSCRFLTGVDDAGHIVINAVKQEGA